LDRLFRQLGNLPGNFLLKSLRLEQAIEGSQHRSLTFSLEGCELKAESGILYRNGSTTAHQETNESKNGQKENEHVSRLFVFILFQVNLLQADGIMARRRVYTERNQSYSIRSWESNNGNPDRVDTGQDGKTEHWLNVTQLVFAA
jgi:hypothetical protein